MAPRRPGRSDGSDRSGRTLSGVGTILDELDQDPSGALGVDEGDESLVRARARYFIDESESAFFEECEGGAQIIDPVGQVMQPRPPAVEEPGDR